MDDTNPPLVEMTRISKEFPGVKALDGVDFTLHRGEVHVLFGENGAGKSTLISILSGLYRPTSGSLRIDGEEVDLRSVHDAAKYGIGTVFQEFSLIPTLRVFENVYLGREIKRGPLTDRRAMVEGARTLFRDLGFEIDIRRRVSTLSRAEQQMVEIAKVFLAKAQVLILDEPTASLTEKETRKLFAFIAKAKADGVGIIYISHRIQEFREIADNISVLRDGRLIGTVSARDTSEKALVELMTGRAIDQIYPEIGRQPDGRTLMTLRQMHGAGFHGVDIDVRAGEVLGIAGLVGSGKSRIWRSVLGLQPIRAGVVTLNGRDVTHAATRHMLRGGVYYLPPDRKSEGLQLAATARENIKLSLLGRADMAGRFGIVAPRRIKALADKIGERVGIASGHMGRIVSKLSGGNQQKVLFGKGFGEERDIYIFDEPTVGVDMGTRAALYRLIKEIAEAGKAVVVISSDLPEVMNLAHRLLVFSKGRVSAELTGTEIAEENVLKHFFAETGIQS
ncbi:sugar ABC transporter ATP-binding protein [Mesorhizobium tianshanense]|uniref:Ribose transport system ATP-binding protein n=1 Tax=Mesorhizobium tianshanense TaxID=39844 RepID=A0A562P1M1_9HYPH|nr:sugar ABC transporter ATP-binding protein [Mesorhizobium tianshanense]TWI38377.1 ribose transport system ATP-binding protein [Mesorhizobium tianshanense]GLS38648.1 sugar ABC transporter ATP-binding protein [Mesorhizobium tianshanense]